MRVCVLEWGRCGLKVRSVMIFLSMCGAGINIVYERSVALYNADIFVHCVENGNTIFVLYLAKSSRTDDKFLKGNVVLFCVLCILHSTM